MGWASSIAVRKLEPEVMDSPDLGSDLHADALQGLSRLNALSGSVGITWPSIASLAKSHRRPLRILDLATGAGDIPIGLWRRARRVGLRLDIQGVDVSPRAVEWAEQRAARAGADVQFGVMDVMSDPLPTGFDVVTSSLFLHHLTDRQAIQLLAAMGQAAGSLVLVNDLVRCYRGLLLAYLAARLFTRSKVVHTDAVLSVRAAFTLQEFRHVANSAGLIDAKIRPRWPSRALLTWSPA